MRRHGVPPSRAAAAARWANLPPSLITAASLGTRIYMVMFPLCRRGGGDVCAAALVRRDNIHAGGGAEARTWGGGRGGVAKEH